MHFSQSRIYLSISIFIYLSLYIFISLYLFIYISIISIPICTMWNTPIMRTMWQKQSVKRFSLCNFHISFHGEGLYKLRVVCTFCHIHVRRKKLTNVWLIYAFLPPPPPGCGGVSISFSFCLISKQLRVGLYTKGLWIETKQKHTFWGRAVVAQLFEHVFDVQKVPGPVLDVTSLKVLWWKGMWKVVDPHCHREQTMLTWFSRRQRIHSSCVSKESY